MTQATAISGGQSGEGEGGCSYIFIKNTNVYLKTDLLKVWACCIFFMTVSANSAWSSSSRPAPVFKHVRVP